MFRTNVNYTTKKSRPTSNVSLLEFAFVNKKNKDKMSAKSHKTVKDSFAARNPCAQMHYSKITAFKDRDGRSIENSLVFNTCDLPWSSQWTTFNAGKSVMEAVNSQVNRRFQEGEADYRATERAEIDSEAILRKKLVKGISGEFAFYEYGKGMQFQRSDIMQPRDDGPSWFGDIIFFDGTYAEIKTTEGEFIPGQYNRLKDLPHAQKKREYSKNSPSFVFNVADQFGNKSREHTCKVARKASFTNEFFIGQRHRVVKTHEGKRIHQYKISFIVRMVDLERRVEVDGELCDIWDLVTVPWDDEREDMKGFCRGKARLIEELLIETFIKYGIPFYQMTDLRYISNAAKCPEIKSPTGVQQIEQVYSHSASKFGALYDSDSDSDSD